MDGINCANLEKDCGERGDEHYRDFGIWIRNRFNEDFFETARDSALAYQAALILLVECLVGHESTPQIEKKIETIIELQALVAKDIDLLMTHVQASEIEDLHNVVDNIQTGQTTGPTEILR